MSAPVILMASSQWKSRVGRSHMRSEAMVLDIGLNWGDVMLCDVYCPIFNLSPFFKKTRCAGLLLAWAVIEPNDTS